MDYCKQYRYIDQGALLTTISDDTGEEYNVELRYGTDMDTKVLRGKLLPHQCVEFYDPDYISSRQSKVIRVFLYSTSNPQLSWVLDTAVGSALTTNGIRKEGLGF